MRFTDFSSSPQEHLVKNLDGDWSFSPPLLPPALPSPGWDFTVRLTQAERAVSELKGLATTLPNPYLLAGAFARREATLSSRIEGTQSGLRELLLFEVGESAAQKTDAREISNYILALEHGLKRIREIPLCLNLMLEMHQLLLAGDVRGNDQSPGKWRESKVWIGPRGCKIGSATYVPPPPGEAKSAMRGLENYIHDQSPLPFLVRLALVHYQFEAIHPFRDGNGRIGRLLIPLMLCERGFLEQPLLYLSAFFERHRDDYYALLLGVSQHGEWMEWVEFFLRGVAEEGQDGVKRARTLLALRDKYRRHIETSKLAAGTLAVVDSLFSSPVLSPTRLRDTLDLSYNAIQSAIAKLEAEGIVEEVTGKARNRIYIAQEILSVLQQGEA